MLKAEFGQSESLTAILWPAKCISFKAYLTQIG